MKTRAFFKLRFEQDPPGLRKRGYGSVPEVIRALVKYTMS